MCSRKSKPRRSSEYPSVGRIAKVQDRSGATARAQKEIHPVKRRSLKMGIGSSVEGHLEEPPTRGGALPAGGPSSSVKSVSRAPRLLVDCRIQRGWVYVCIEIWCDTLPFQALAIGRVPTEDGYS